MNIIIYGAGALGSFVGGMLSTKNTVTLVGRSMHVHAVLKKGLRISENTKKVVYPAAVTTITDVANLARIDLVILTVKAFDTPAASANIVQYCDAPILSLQNGLNNECLISNIAGDDRVVGGVTTHGIKYIEPGHICHTGSGITTIGELDGSLSKRVKGYAGIFNHCGIPTEVSQMITRELWRKAMVNAAINPLSAILKCKNGYLLENEAACRIMTGICQEVAAVASATDVEIGSDMMAQVVKVAHLTRENQSSMLQSILQHKPTEIDQINGVIMNIGNQHGIATPVNSTLINIIKALER